MSLLAFPEEILGHIIGHLVPPLVDTLGTSREKYIHKTKPWRTSRRSLLALTKTCRRLFGLTTPLLYEVIVLTDGPSMVLLLRSILHNPDLPQYIHHFGFVARLESGTVQQDIRDTFGGNDWRSLGTSLSRGRQGLLHSCLVSDHTEKLAHSSFALLVSLLPRLRNFLIYTPGLGEHDYSLFIEALISIHSTAGTPVFSTHRLINIASPKTNAPDPCIDWGFATSLVGIGNVRSLELFGDDIRQHRRNIEDPGTATWDYLEEIRLELTGTETTGWYALCCRCPNLRAIRIVFAPPYLKRLAGTTNHSWVNFNYMLRMQIPTLQSLSIDTHGNRYFFNHLATQKRDPNELASEPPNLGPRREHPDSYLDSLPCLVHLKHLQVEIMFLFSRPRYLELRDIRDLLPASIETFKLLEVWSEEEEDKMDFSLSDRGLYYSRRLTRMLGNLVIHSKDALPNLKRVEFFYTWEAYKSPGEFARWRKQGRTGPSDIFFHAQRLESI
jgi:hypothetical protein